MYNKKPVFTGLYFHPALTGSKTPIPKYDRKANKLGGSRAARKSPIGVG